MPTIKHSTKNTCSRTQCSLGMPLSNVCKDKISCYYWSVVITYITFKGLYLCWFITNTTTWWRFIVDKNQSTAIAPIFKIVIEFLFSIFFHYQVVAMKCLQSNFCKLSFVNWVFCNWIFAIKFLQSSFCNQIFANWFFLQSSFANWFFCNRVFAN